MAIAPTAERVEKQGWLLVLDPPVVPSVAPPGSRPWMAEPILGLPVLLRLALTAQAAGASGIALSTAAALRPLRALLADDRLHIPVSDEADRPSIVEFRMATPSVRIPANTVIHRATLAALKERADEGEVDVSFSGAPRGAGGFFGFEPMFVHDRASARAAERALLRSLRKPQDGWASTHLNRHISLFLTRWLVSTRLLPNQVSIGILFIGLLGAWFASRGTYATMLLGAALFQAQSVLDGCDGEMSRLTFRGSVKGEWLDTIGDDLTNYAFFAGAAWGLFGATGRPLYLGLGAVLVASGIVGSGLEYRYLARIGSGDLLKYPLGIGKAPGGGEAAKSGLARALDAISPLFKRDTFVLLTLVGAALGWLGPFLAVASAGAVGVLTAVVRAELRMSRAARVDPALPRD
jgi:1L-myo-inositol 1-phosphate cytidylyltransferase / CDP-L-myo-inositol myo-inositolphosphotransferase